MGTRTASQGWVSDRLRHRGRGGGRRRCMRVERCVRVRRAHAAGLSASIRSLFMRAPGRKASDLHPFPVVAHPRTPAHTQASASQAPSGLGWPAQPTRRCILQASTRPWTPGPLAQQTHPGHLRCHTLPRARRDVAGRRGARAFRMPPPREDGSSGRGLDARRPVRTGCTSALVGGSGDPTRGPGIVHLTQGWQLSGCFLAPQLGPRSEGQMNMMMFTAPVLPAAVCTL